VYGRAEEAEVFDNGKAEAVIRGEVRRG